MFLASLGYQPGTQPFLRLDVSLVENQDSKFIHSTFSAIYELQFLYPKNAGYIIYSKSDPKVIVKIVHIKRISLALNKRRCQVLYIISSSY